METDRNGNLVRTLAVLLTGTVLLCACSGHRKDAAESALFPDFTDTLVLSAERPNLSIQNNSGKAVQFRLKLNGQFPMTIAEMVDAIRKESADDSVSTAIGAWRFICGNTYHLDPYSPDPWIHDPYILVNSLSGGFCDDRSAALALLWSRLGYGSRVVELNGHVVCEVKEQGRWELFDPDHEIYYVSKDGRIAGVQQLEQHACDGLRIVGFNTVQNILWDCGTLDSDFQMRLYTSADDNKDATPWHMDFAPLQDDRFILPSGASLIFLQGNGEHPDIAMVKLTSGTSGLVHIPLVPYAIIGEGTVMIGTEHLNFTEKNVLKLPNGRLYDSLYVKEVVQTSYIYFHVNPILCAMADTNRISILNPTGHLDLVAEGPEQVVFNMLRRDALMLRDSMGLAAPLAKQLASRQPPASIDGMREQFVQYLQEDTGVSSTVRDSLIRDFPILIKQVMDTVGVDRQQFPHLISQRYPQSLFWVFLAIRFNGYRYLHKFRSADRKVHLSQSR